MLCQWVWWGDVWCRQSQRYAVVAASEAKQWFTGKEKDFQVNQDKVNSSSAVSREVDHFGEVEVVLAGPVVYVIKITDDQYCGWVSYSHFLKRCG